MKSSIIAVPLLCLLAAASLVLCADDASSSSARLLVYKQVHNKYLVEGRDILIEYSIFNVGSSAALKVHLSDATLPEESFEIVRGLVNVQLDRIAPGTNVSHSVVVRPRFPGPMNFSAAEIYYLPTETSESEQIVYSSEPGQGDIAGAREFDRRFSPHILDWLAFAIMTLPSLGIPFYLWFQSKSRYTSILKQQAKKN